MSGLTFLSHDVVVSEVNGAASVSVADLNGDGAVDVLATSAADNTLVWYENTGRNGRLGPPKVIGTAIAGAGPVHAADLDGDGDADALSVTAVDNRVA